MNSVCFHAVGRRKKAIARVRLIPGEGNITINKRNLEEYFGYETLKTVVRQPLVLTDTLGKFDVVVNCKGGGFTGQAGAIRHGARLSSPSAKECSKPLETQRFRGFPYFWMMPQCAAILMRSPEGESRSMRL